MRQEYICLSVFNIGGISSWTQLKGSDSVYVQSRNLDPDKTIIEHSNALFVQLHVLDIMNNLNIFDFTF